MIPESLFSDVMSGELILFLGAGSSTEGFSYFRIKLTDVLAERCKYPKTSTYSLPYIAQYYCDTLDGGFKGRLIREIRSYLDMYMDAGEAYRTVTMIHKIVAKIGFFKNIITTNWDVFLERELNLIPIVRDTDLVFWNDEKRQLIKMHGCISQPDTMIITVKDYDDYISKNIDTPISNKIKDMLATKSFLFVGYSLRDENFRLIQDKILSRMGSFSRTSYAIMREPSEEDVEYWKKRGIMLLPYNALSFFRDLFDYFIKEGYYFDNKTEFRLRNKYDEIAGAHYRLNQESNAGFPSAMYQDGLMHCIEGVILDVGRGKKRDDIKDEIKELLESLDLYHKSENWIEVAYTKGRLNALYWIFNESYELKHYMNNDTEPITEEQYTSLQKETVDSQ